MRESGASGGARPGRARRPTTAVAGVLLLMALGVWIGVPVPAGWLRASLERRAEEALGRPVQVGSLGLRLGWHARVEAEDVRVLGGGPDPAAALLEVGTLRLEADLVALLRRRLHVREARARGVVVRAGPSEAPPKTRAGDPPRAAPGEVAAPASSWTLDVDRLALDEVELRRNAPGGTDPIVTRLARLRGRLRWNEAVRLALRGDHDGVPFSAELEGGAPSAWRSEAVDWPLRLEAALAGGSIEVATRVRTRDGALRLEDITGRLGSAELAGALAFAAEAGRPRVEGRIALGDVPLAPASGAPSPGTPAPGPGRAPDAATRGEPDAEPSPGPLVAAARLLHGFEADVELRIARLVAPGPPVEDVRVAVRVDEGILALPIALRVAAIPLAGSLRLEDAASGPGLGLSLRAEASSVDALFDALAPDAHVRGAFGSLAVELEGRLGSLGRYLATLRARLEAADARLTYGAADPKPVVLDAFALSADASEPLRIEARGALLGVPVEASARAGSLAALLDDAVWPLRITARGAGATLELEGRRHRDASGRRLEAGLRLRGDRPSELAPWVGRLPVADAPYALRAELAWGPGRRELRLHEGRVGGSVVRGTIGRLLPEGGGDGIPFVVLEADRLDVTELAAGREQATRSPPAARRAPERPATLDIPLLPGGLRMADADLDLDVAQLRVGELELTGLRFDGAIRDGHLSDAPLGVTVAGVPFRGTLALDLRESPHEARFALSARAVDLGRAFERLGFAEGLELSAGRLDLELRADGATAGELLAEVELAARVEDAHWILRDALSGEELASLDLAHATLRRSREEPDLALEAEGSLRGEPVTLEARMPKISLLHRSAERLPLALTLRAAGATLGLETRVALPIERRELDLSLRLEGERLDRAVFLLGRELPPIGPYQGRTRVRLTPQDYRLTELALRVGASSLRGSGLLDTRGARPRLALDLVGERIQLDDFLRARPSSSSERTGKRGSASSEAKEQKRAGGSAASASGAPPRTPAVDRLLSPERLRGVDGRLTVRVDEVRSGPDVLGRGELTVALEDGRLRVEPLALEVPGGSAALHSEIAAVGEGVEGRLAIRSRRFDYGILARRVDPQTEMAGWISLDVDFAGRAPRPSGLLAGSSGRFDLLAAPEGIQTDVFDLWAVNVLRVLLPRLDEGPRSRLNCVVARFGLEDGVMRERSLFLDTTGMVVKGRATVDFRERRLHAILAPTPKKPQMLSLQTRVEVSGAFDDFSLRVPPQEFVTTFVRFVTSVVVTPLQRVLRGSLPADGEATCREAWRRGEAPAAASP